MNRKARVLFVYMYKQKSSFIQRDLELLTKNLDIRLVEFILRKKNLKETIFTLQNLFLGIIWADVTFSWFAEYPAFWTVKLSKIFNKKSIVVIGGFEVAKIPEIGYGSMLNPKSAHVVKYILNNADKIIVVDDGLKNNAIEYTGTKGDNIITVPTGYDYRIFKPNGEKETLVLSVCSGDNWQRVKLKGLDTFVESAKLLKDIKFIIIGIQGNGLKSLQKIAPPNVKFVNQMPTNELLPYYQKAKVYCQLSMREGLPNAICEAMLCECVPVGTDVQGIRTAIGDTGFYAPYGDVNATVAAIKKAIKSNKGKLARERIINRFPIDKREIELKELINVMVYEQ